MPYFLINSDILALKRSRKDYMKGYRVLVVDDDSKTVDLITLYLKREGYTVLTAYDGPAALRKARSESPDIIILDVMLPGLDGVSICRQIREESSAAIIMLTARTTEQDRLTGLEVGADDYVIKPFSPRELVARIKAVLRRLPDTLLGRGEEVLKAGALEMNFKNQELKLEGKSVELTPLEFRLLGTLMRSSGRAFTREQLVSAVYGMDFDGSDRTIDVHIRNLRKKIGDGGRAPRYILTVFGVGYKFAPVGGL